MLAFLKILNTKDSSNFCTIFAVSLDAFSSLSKLL